MNASAISPPVSPAGVQARDAVAARTERSGSRVSDDPREPRDAASSRLRIEVLSDSRDEGWPSMDLVSEMLLDQWRTGFASDVDARELELPIARVARRVPALADRPVAFNVDRIVARFVTYPARALASREASTLYHVADHTYAQLVHVLPSSRTGVYCHDLDAFRSLVGGVGRAREPRPAWFRALARIILRGMQSAAVVFHSTRAVGDEMVRLGIVDAARLVHAPYGVSPEFDATPRASDGEALAPIGGRRFVLHVGNALPRKRLDVLFDAFARLRAADPELRLVQQGAALSAEQQRHVREAGIFAALLQPPKLPRAVLAGLYRRAAVVLVPSDAEGFGFPVIEALASGAVVVASDIPVLREVGGDAVIYCPPGDAAAWASTVAAVLEGRHAVPSRKARLAQAARFTWHAHARTILDAYRRLDDERAR